MDVNIHYVMHAERDKSKEILLPTCSFFHEFYTFRKLH